MALILRNGGSQSPDRWLREPRNNHFTDNYLDSQRKLRMKVHNITSIDAEHDISMREVYGLDKMLRE